MALRHRTRLWLQALEDRRTPATFTVDNTFDGGLGSLRQAIQDSNNSIGADIIDFDPAAFASAQTITLTSPLPNISDDLSIAGPGSKLLTVTRNAPSGEFRIFAVKNLDTILSVSMSGMSITNGYCNALSQTDNGGGIYVGPIHTLTLDSVVLSGNTSSAQGGGIAMDVGARLTITNSTISGNTALGLEFGEPFTGFSGVGAGIYFTQDGSLTLLNSTIDNNVAKSSGGGIFLYGESSGTGLIRNSTISSNKVTTANTFVFRSGGAGIAILTNSFNGGSGTYSLTIQNSTVTGNSAAGASYGGGIQLLASSAASSTGKINLRLESTIVAGNLVGSGGLGPDIFGAATSGFTKQNVVVDYSAIGNNSTTGFTTTPGPGGAGSNQFGAVTLGALAYNPAAANVRTHLPPNGSPLIDKGSNPGAIGTDGRNLTRFYDDGAVTGTLTTDIGAVEIQPPGYPIAIATAPTITAPGGTIQTITVVYQDETGIDTTTIGNGDILVTGPSFSKTGTLVNLAGSGTSVTATYTVPSVAGGWVVSADGVYTISTVLNQVLDSNGNAEQVGPIGSFQVAIPRTLIVTTTTDSINGSDGKLSLREAIISANSLYPSNDTITLDPALMAGGFLSWSSLGQMFITDSVTIQGTNPGAVTLSGGAATRHFNLDGPGKLDVRFSGVSINNGYTALELQSERGGAIFNMAENLIMDNVWMSSNQAANSYGGAIHIQGNGSLTFSNGQMIGNLATNRAGGAISALSPGHSITIMNSTLAGNIAGFYGGAISSTGGGTVVIDRTTIRNNSTTKLLSDDGGGKHLRGGGGGVMVANGVIIAGSLVEEYPSFSSLTVTDSLFDGNKTAWQGGAFMFNGTGPGVLLRNTTIINNQTTGNTPDNVGSAFVVGNLDAAPVLIEFCTIVNNKAYGAAVAIDDLASSNVKAVSSIIALNICADPSQIPVDFGGNMQANYCFLGTDSGFLESGSDNNIGMGAPGSPEDPLIESLAFNGGPTETMKLMDGSPCINKGSNPNNLLYDQRGIGFARVVGGQPDIGAYELETVIAPPPPTVTDVEFGDGTDQRSMVKRIVVTFSEQVNFLNNVVDAFTLTRTGTGGTLGDVDLIADPVSGPTNVVTLTFFGVFSENESLIDGFYNFIIDAAEVSGAGGALDGNGDTIPGGSFSVTGNTTNKYFRLFGDANGSGLTDLIDFAAFRDVFNLGANDVFDYDNSSNIDLLDFARFRASFNISP